MTGRPWAMGLERGALSRPGGGSLRIGGTLLLLAGMVILMAIITAEALYPAPYSTGTNAISDLGGTEPPEAIVRQPSATIFDTAMIVSGALVLGGAWLVHRGFGRRSVSLPIAVLGIAAVGVGVFPGNTGTIHALFAMAAFVSGGVAALTAAVALRGPFRVVSIVLGAVALLTLASYLLLGDASPLEPLGLGGIERWIVYPTVLWLVAFGGWTAGWAEAA
jgi:hypothetical membrane protein